MTTSTAATGTKVADEAWQATPPPAEFGDKGAPRIDTQEEPACPVCGGESYDQFAVGFDYELQTCSNPWRFVQCRNCGHIWLNPRPAVSALPVIYPPTYYAYNYSDQVNPIAAKAKSLLDGMKIKSVLKALGRTPQSFLDIGCGDGRFLRLMERQGVARQNNYGLELDEKVVAALAGSGYRAYCRRVEDCTEIAEGSIDLATMFHVIEHVDDPRGVARRVASWLTPGGVFAVETPNIDSYDARKFKESFWGGYHIPRHWNLFGPATLAKLLSDVGLEVLATKYQTGHSFWMYSYHHRTRYGPNQDVKGAAKFNPFGGSLLRLAAFTGFDKVRAAMGRKTSAMLMLARKPA